MPWPSNEDEQRAIAAALSDVDALLGGLDRLIAKKRDLKQAAMQQLLTGQTRLPGFHGEWEVKRLGDVGDIISGGTRARRSAILDGDSPFVHADRYHDASDRLSICRDGTTIYRSRTAIEFSAR